MKNPWITYSLARIGFFVLFLAIFLLLGFDGIFSALVSGALALAVSLILLQKQRDALSREIYNRFRRDKEAGVPDQDADLENALLDLDENNKKPEAKQ